MKELLDGPGGADGQVPGRPPGGLGGHAWLFRPDAGEGWVRLAVTGRGQRGQLTVDLLEPLARARPVTGIGPRQAHLAAGHDLPQARGDDCPPATGTPVSVITPLQAEGRHGRLERLLQHPFRPVAAGVGVGVGVGDVDNVHGG